MQISSGYWLTKIRLHHWHAATDLEIDIPLGSGLHLEGDTGVGKTTILDAVMWALIGDEKKVHFNKAASSREAGSTRTLHGYVRCEEGDRLYRRERGTAHVLLEFTHAQSGDHVIIGSLIDYTPEDRDPLFIIAQLPLSTELIATPNGQVYTTREFEKYVQRRFAEKVQYFHRAGEYREALSKYFGLLPKRFFEILSHLTGQHDQPNLDTFIRGVLFEDDPLDLSDLKEQVNELRKANQELEEAQKRHGALTQIAEAFQAWEDKSLKHEVYQICELQAQRAKEREDQNRADEQIVLLNASLLESNLGFDEAISQVNDADKNYRDWILRQQSEARVGELETIQKQAKLLRKEIDQLLENHQQQQKTISNLILWVQKLPGLFEGFFSISQQDRPQALMELGNILANPTEKMDVTALRTSLNNLLAWMAYTRSEVDQQRRNHRYEIEQRRTQLDAIRQGKIPNQRAYTIRDHLRSRFGYVEVLCDLVESADPDWQPVVEMMMGARLFSLVTEDGNYEEGLKEFLSLPTEMVDGVHLTRPRDALRSQTITPDSLASKVNTSNPIARGLLNYHLNRWWACDLEQEAVRSDRSAVTRGGVIVSGGTIQRRRLPRLEELAIGIEARNLQRDCIAKDTRSLENKLIELENIYKDLESLEANIRANGSQLDRLNPEIKNQLEQKQIELEGLQEQAIEIESSTNFVYLAEQVTRSKENYEKAVGQRERLKTKIENDQKLLRDLKRDTEQLIIQGLATEQKLQDLKPDEITWQVEYTQRSAQAKGLSELITTVHTLSAEIEQQIGLAWNQLADRVNRYVIQNRPQMQSLNLEDRLRICLGEFHDMQDVQIKQLTEAVSKLRYKSEDILFRKFIDRLRRSHREIELDIRKTNRTVEPVLLGRRRYRFTRQPIAGETIRQVLDMVHDYDRFSAENAGLDLTSQLREKYPDLISRLFNLFAPPNDALNAEDARLKNILLTPARYFYFDLDVSEDNRDWMPLSHIYRKGSGGEHQNPLYVVLIATMLQIYENDINRLRLLVLDEAFSKAPGSSVNGIQMMLEQGLQPLVSTPVGRPEVEEVVGYTLHVYRDPEQRLRTATTEEIQRAVHRGRLAGVISEAEKK